jgi:putative two-component system response regulator
MVDEKTAEIQTSLWMIKKSEQDIINILGKAGEYRDTDTGNHVTRMSYYCELLAKKLNLSEDEQSLVLQAAPMHDIGKIGIPDVVLLKQGRLDHDEFEIMKTHAQIGYDILSSKNTPLMQVAKQIALTHHEKWDGSGYPNSLRGEEIPLFGRICSIADVFDALLSKRPYKKPFTLEEAIAIMEDGRAVHFDPYLLDLFFDSMDEVLVIKSKFE